tara:strand:+ start:1815 stop:2603 length:789 start_codon:yes stop_codon:yes gene_type:complete
MITRVNNITPINNKNNSFILGQLTADYADGTTITSIAVTSTQTALKDGDKFIIAGQVFTVGADAAAASTSITVDSVLLSIPIDIGDNIEINQDNLFVQYQRKTEGTIAGMLVQERDFGPINYIDPVYSIIGVDPTYVKILPRDFMINDDGGNEALEFKDGTNTGLIVGATAQEMIATVNIPYGTTATEVTIWGSSTGRTVEVYEASIAANGIGSAIGTGTSNGSAISITSTTATTTNYLVILVKVTLTSQRVYGGKVTLTQN